MVDIGDSLPLPPFDDDDDVICEDPLLGEEYVEKAISNRKSSCVYPLI